MEPPSTSPPPPPPPPNFPSLLRPARGSFSDRRVVSSATAGDCSGPSTGPSIPNSNVDRPRILHLVRSRNDNVDVLQDLVQVSDSMKQHDSEIAREIVSQAVLPDIVAVGNVCAGRSAVLNGILGHPVFPTGDDFFLRVPISVQMDRDSFLSPVDAIVTLNGDEDINVSAGSDLRIKKSCKYLKEENSVLLLVVSATQSTQLGYSRALKAIQKSDPRGKRTIGLFTKLDKARPEALDTVLRLLSDPGPISWVALVGLYHASDSGSGTIRSIHEKEDMLSILPDAPEEKLGTSALVGSVAGRLRELIGFQPPNPNRLSALRESIVAVASSSILMADILTKAKRRCQLGAVIDGIDKELSTESFLISTNCGEIQRIANITDKTGWDGLVLIPIGTPDTESLEEEARQYVLDYWTRAVNYDRIHEADNTTRKRKREVGRCG